MFEQGTSHAQVMRQKERELLAQVQTQMTEVIHSVDLDVLVAVEEVEVVGVVTTTPEEQDAIRAFLKGLV